MAETQTQASEKSKLSRRTLRALGRKKRKAKLSNKDVAKAYFEAKSKRSDDKKTAYKKRHSKSK